MNLPVWVGWLIAVGAFTALGIPAVQLWLKKEKEAAEFRTPPTPCEVPVTVRGPNGSTVDMLHFADCWNFAYEFVCRHGPWTREQLKARLGYGNMVQVMAEPKWKGAMGALVGGELVGGIIRVGPSLDSLAHELAHRAEQLLEKRTDNGHSAWLERGLTKADVEYRLWLAKRVR